MALDFQRPDPSSPAAVASAQFTLTRRGYREEEVRDFLRQVSVEMARLLERERFLENELKAMQSRGPLDTATIDEATVTELLGAEAARVLSTAREAAQAMRDRAVQSAEQIVRDASREAARSLEEATVEAARRRSDVSSEAEQELELAKQQGREIVAEVRAYRERVLADLAKRSEEARRELERLVHERERLLGAFERARHAATDVVGDLGDFDEAIRDAGIVPPLVPPDAPPPPNPSRGNSAPIFDAMEYKDELGVAHRGGEQIPAETSAAGVAPTTTETNPSSTAPADLQAPVEPETSADLQTLAESETSADLQTAADPEAPVEPETPADSQPMAPVVNLLERRRRKVVTTTSAGDDESASENGDATRTPDATTRRAAAQAAHPVFERVEAREEETPSPPATSRVDAIFARLRSSSPQRVAAAATQDLTAKTPKQQTNSQPEPVKPHPVDTSVFRRRDEAIQSVIETMTRTVKRLLADDENVALTHLGTKRSSLTIDAMIPSVDEWTQRYVDALREQIMSIAVDAARSLSGSRRSDVRSAIGGDAVFGGAAAVIAGSATSVLHQRICEAINRADGDRDALTKAVRSVFVECRATLVEPTVLDVAHFSYARGLFAGCDVGANVCWAVDPDGPSCADAEDNALAGVISHGGAFPTGHIHPLAHAGCRCLVVPTDL